MQVSVEAPTKLERRLTVVVPVEQIDAAYDKRIANIAKTASVKGFRPGNVPVAHIKKLYGDSARQEALSEVIQSSLYAAINQENLNPVGVPTVEPKTVTPGGPLEYTAIFEILPTVENVKFDVKNIEKDMAQVTDADVEKVISRLAEQHTTWHEVNRAAQDKDQVVVDFRGMLEGKVFPGGEAHDYPIIIGSKTMIPGFEEGVIGMTKGEEKIVKVTFPENYFAKEVAGKEAEFTITAHKISEPKTPKMDDNLVKQFGIKSGNIDDLRAEIRKNLEREVDRMTSGKLKAKVFDLLIEQNPLEVPAALIDQEAQRIHNEVHPHHGKDHHHTPAEMEEFKIAAKRNVILGLLIGEFVKQSQLTADKTRVAEHLTKVSSAYENPAEVIKWYSSDKRRLAEIEMYVLEEQVVEKLLEGVDLKEKMLNYNELITG